MRSNKDTIIFLLMSLLIAVLWASAHAQSGFILRGVLTTRTTTTTEPYFKIGEAVAVWVPQNSALTPGLRALEGKKVVITIIEDR